MMRSRTLKLSLSLLLAAAAVVLGGLSFYRKVQSFQPLGFTARMPGGAAWVETVENPGTGLRPGDKVLVVDGTEVAAELDLSRHLKSKPESQLGVLRGDEILPIRYHRPPLAVDFPYLLLSLIGVGYL